MKTRIPLFFMLFAGHFISAQTFELGTNMNLSQPMGIMARNMNNSFGLTLEAARKFKTPFSAGIELAFGNYGHQTTRQQYAFDDGSVTETDVNVGNNITTLYLTGKHFLRQGKDINPYLSGKAGWTWFTTRLTIEDPEDESGCHPLESDILSRDNTYTFSGGAGVRIDLQTIFKKSVEQRVFLDVSIHGTHGGIVEYMNVENHSHHSSAPAQDVIAKFINTQTQVVHEHHVGYVYSSVMNMVEYRLGVVFRPR